MSDNYLMRIFFFALLTLVLINGCSGNRMLSVEDEKIIPIDTTTKTLDEIKKDVVNAGTPMGWVFSEKAPGHLVGILARRTQMAVVDVKYTEQAYNITYKDSENLDYNGSSIHPNYNKWIKNLSDKINTSLSSK